MTFHRKIFCWESRLLHFVVLISCLLLPSFLFLPAVINKPSPVQDVRLQAGYDKARAKRRAAFNLRVCAEYEKALADPKCADLVEHGGAHIVERIVGRKFGLTGDEVRKILRSRLNDAQK